MAKAHVVRELKVVFDTNVLHTQVPSDLVSAAASALIEKNSLHPDLKVTWYIPEVVLLERHYQMHRKAEQLLQSFQKMDAILGFNISLTSEQLSPKILQVIDSEVTRLNFVRLPLIPARVNWLEIIKGATARSAPFQQGDTEKGFKDAMILETFLQLVEDSPRSPKSCRIVLVTNDDRLLDAAATRAKHCANVEILRGHEEVQNLVNTLISTVDEEVVKVLREKARKLFFIPADKETLYFREDLPTQITKKYREEVISPPGADGQDIEKIYVGQPTFVRKEGQRVHWLSQVEYVLNAYKWSVSTSPSSAEAANSTLAGLMRSPPPSSSEAGLPTLLGDMFAYGPREKTQTKKGRSIFNVTWSVTLDKNKRLTRPQIDGVTFDSSVWE